MSAAQGFPQGGKGGWCPWILSVIGSILGAIAFGLQIPGSSALAGRIPHADTRLQRFNSVFLTLLMVVAFFALSSRSTRSHFAGKDHPSRAFVRGRRPAAAGEEGQAGESGPQA